MQRPDFATLGSALLSDNPFISNHHHSPSFAPNHTKLSGWLVLMKPISRLQLKSLQMAERNAPQRRYTKSIPQP